MNFKAVKSWPQVRQALCELSQCVKNAGGPIESVDSGLRIDQGVLNLGAATSELDAEGILKSNTYFTLTDPVLEESYVSIFLGNGRFGGALLTLTSEDLVTGEYSQTSFTPKSLGLTVRDTNEDIISLALTVDSGASITDDIFSKGLYYNSDYSAAQIGDNDIPSIKRVKQLQGTLRPIIQLSSGTAANTATKLAFGGEGYVPQFGDIVYLTLDNANTANNPSVNINSSGPRSIQIAGQNPTATAAKGTKWLMWCDGLNFQLFGNTSIADANSTYNEINTINIQNPSGVPNGLISGRRFSEGFHSRIQALEAVTPLGNVFEVDITKNIYVYTLDLINGNNAIVLLAGLAGSRVSNSYRFTVILKQPSTGAAGTITFHADSGLFVGFPGSIVPVLSSTNDSIDILEFMYIGTTESFMMLNFIPDLRYIEAPVPPVTP